ncbi:MAG: right-handed parallel beta-helix repeat-containing protein [Clostridia bacterium]|nr:right-handed parallel beta-helix repeat-containing protein [Clostridia bacterium]
MKAIKTAALLLAMVLALNAFCFAAAETGEKAPVLVAYGDSIAAAGSWESEFKALSGETVINSGVGGDTSANGLARFDAAVKAKNPDVVFIGFGTNDASIDMERYVPVETYMENLRTAVDKITALGAKAIIITPPPIVDEPYFTRHDKSKFSQFDGANGLVSVYALAARRVAAEKKVAVADVNKAFSERDFSKLIADGVHPNAQGYKLYAETVLNAYYHAVRGDINLDGRIAAADYAMAKRAYLGTYVTGALGKPRADVNENGKLDAADYAMLKRHVLNTYVIEVSEKLEDLPELPHVDDPPEDDFYNPYEVKTDRDSLTGLVIDANLVPDKKDAATMAANTAELQRCVDAANAAGGGTVYCPAGTFYFSQQGVHVRGFEAYVCIPKDNVLVIGAGWTTKFKPVGESEGGLDMFYFNEYADSGFKNPKYLVNADFKNFVIDSELTHCRRYTSAGKGFMINLYKDCDYENVIVMNTDGTGFGMDCPINCTIRNCRAKNCGKAATTATVGASGIGMGTGYSEDETILIENCLTVGNKKFGIFFEHQGRFGASRYTAQSLKNIEVRNCVAYDNYIDFGGELAVDVVFRNCTVPENSTATTKISYRHHSIRCWFFNMDVGGEFDDVTDKDSPYYKPVYWAVSAGITTGVGKNLFGTDTGCQIAQAITFLYRAAGCPGALKLVNTAEKVYYEDALEWAKGRGLVSEDVDPTAVLTQEGFIDIMWKYAGKPASAGEYTAAKNWALNNGIATEITSATADRGYAVTALYNYFYFDDFGE